MIRIWREGWVCLAAALGLRAAGVADPPTAAAGQPGWDGKATVYSIVLDFVFGGGVR